MKISPSLSGAASSCGNLTQVRWYASADGGEAALKIALSAKLANAPVTLNVFTGSTCINGYPQLQYIYQ